MCDNTGCDCATDNELSVALDHLHYVKSDIRKSQRTLRIAGQALAQAIESLETLQENNHKCQNQPPKPAP